MKSKDTQFAAVKLPKCLEGPHNTGIVVGYWRSSSLFGGEKLSVRLDRLLGKDNTSYSLQFSVISYNSDAFL